MKFTHILTNGCSWTYGDELENPRQQAWPALLANRLKIPLVNIAVKGSGNDAICRRTIEYLYQNLSTRSKPLVILAWSQITRKEAWDEKFLSYQPIACIDHKNLSHTEKSYLENWNMFDHYTRNLISKISLISVLENLNIPYFIGPYENSELDYLKKEADEQTKQQFLEMSKSIDNNPNVWKTPLIDYCSNTRKFPNGHEMPEGHQIISNVVFNGLLERFQSVEHVNGQFLTAKQFSQVNRDFKHQGHSFHDWLD